MLSVEQKVEWVKALRSGKYKQGKTALKRGDKYCCLGVLCDISGLGTWKKRQYGEGDLYVIHGFEEYSTLLPDELACDLPSKEQWHLAEMNDSKVVENDFNIIADWIEANL